MKLLLTSLGLLVAAGSLWAQSADDITAAAKKRADQGGYQWVAKTDYGANSQMRVGPTDGLVDKDGWALVKMTRGDNTTEMVVKGDKGAYKADGDWKVVDTAVQGGGGGGGGQPDPGRSAARALRTFKLPTAEVTEMAAKCKDFKKDGDAITATLSDDAAKALMSFGGRRGGPGGGGGGPEISDAKGTAKFWIKDGVLGKYEYHVQGKMSINGTDREIDRTTTVELKDGAPAADAIPQSAKKLAS